MSSRFLQYIGTLAFLFSAFYVVGLFDLGYTSKHSSLNEDAVEPDLYMSNARHYAKEDKVVERSLMHLDRAIDAIRKIEGDIDLGSRATVDDAVKNMERVYNRILGDSAMNDDMNLAFEYALNALTLAELRVSEKYAESNNPKMARVALKYAKMHLKSAGLYSSLKNYEKEQHIYYEIDSLIKAGDISSVLITEKIDHFIQEMDSVIAFDQSQIH